MVQVCPVESEWMQPVLELHSQYNTFIEEKQKVQRQLGISQDQPGVETRQLKQSAELAADAVQKTDAARQRFLARKKMRSK